ncbi:catalase family peroxidase [Bradyrhizobium sp. MOS001]|nr:catalase family peroxidase [Bradyrhizobium sp. MOS001]
MAIVRLEQHNSFDGEQTVSTNSKSETLSGRQVEPANPLLQPPTALAAQAAQLVDDLRLAFGRHRARAVHAKGIILTGNFLPSETARTLSKAALFSGPAIPVIIRFSNFTGIPNIPDNIIDANPRGLAIKLGTGGFESLDIVSHSFNGFPVSTAQEFGILLRSIASSGAGVPKPTPLDKYLESHAIAKRFLTTQEPPPESYATTAYFGVNSVAFLNEANERTFVRYRFVPEAGEHYLDEATRKSMGPNYLSEEIATRIATAPIRFDWYAQLATADDEIEDPSIAWPESRATAKLGTISIECLVPDQQEASRSLLFMPATFPPGIEAADPMLAVREVAYPISYDERR